MGAGDQVQLEDHPQIAPFRSHHRQRREAVPRKQRRDVQQGHGGIHRHQVGRHDVARGLRLDAVGCRLDLGGGDQARQVLDAQVQRLAIADEDVRQFFLGQAQALDGRGIGGAVGVRLVELAEGIAPPGRMGIDKGDRHQQRRSRRHRHEGKAQTQGRDLVRPDGHRHRHRAARRMRGPAQRHRHDRRPDRQRNGNHRIARQTANQQRHKGRQRIADNRGPGLGQRAVRGGKDQDRGRPEGRDQIDAQPQFGRGEDRQTPGHGKPDDGADARAQRLGRGNGGDGRSQGPEPGMARLVDKDAHDPALCYCEPTPRKWAGGLQAVSAAVPTFAGWPLPCAFG